MLTQCPACNTIYRLGANDLSSAHGFVECGECDTQFNALERLADEPNFAANADVSSPESPPDAAPGTRSGAAIFPSEPGPVSAQAALSSGDDAAGDIDSDATLELQRSVTENSPKVTPASPETPHAVDAPAPLAAAESEFARASSQPDTQPAASFALPSSATLDLGVVDDESRGRGSTLSDNDHAILFTEPDLEATPLEGAHADEIDLDEVPAILQAEVAALRAPPQRRAAVVWVLFSVGLLAVLAVQAAWVWRAQVHAAIPQSVSWYEAACERLACDAHASSDPDRIELIARDVRDHPRYRDTLLVNATLSSRSEAIAPFPVIQLGLHGEGGEIIGIRRFEPREYLDVSIDLEAGMPPGRPVYIVLEIAQVSARAVGFEFKFL